MEEKGIQGKSISTNIQGPKARWSSAFMNETREGVEERSLEKVELKTHMETKRQEQRQFEQQQQKATTVGTTECIGGAKDHHPGTDFQKQSLGLQGRDDYCAQNMNPMKGDYGSQLGMKAQASGLTQGIPMMVGTTALTQARSMPYTSMSAMLAKQFNARGQQDHLLAHRQSQNRFTIGQYDHNNREGHFGKFVQEFKHQQEGRNIRAAYHQQFQKLRAPEGVLEFNQQARLDYVNPLAQSYSGSFSNRRSSGHPQLNKMLQNFANAQYPLFAGNDVNNQGIPHQLDQQRGYTTGISSTVNSTLDPKQLSTGPARFLAVTSPRPGTGSIEHARTERSLTTGHPPRGHSPLPPRGHSPRPKGIDTTLSSDSLVECKKTDPPTPISDDSSAQDTNKRSSLGQVGINLKESPGCTNPCEVEQSKLGKHSQDKPQPQINTSMETSSSESQQSKTVEVWKGMGLSETYEKYEHFIQKQNTYIQELVNDPQASSATDTEQILKKVENFSSKSSHTHMSTYESKVTNRNMAKVQSTKGSTEKEEHLDGKRNADLKETAEASKDKTREDEETTDLETALERKKEFEKHRIEDMKLDKEQNDLLEKLIEAQKAQNVSQNVVMYGQMSRMFNLMKAVETRMHGMTSSRQQRRASTVTISEVTQRSDETSEDNVATKSITWSNSCQESSSSSTTSYSSTIKSSIESSSSTETGPSDKHCADDESKSNTALFPYCKKEMSNDIPMIIISKTDESDNITLESENLQDTEATSSNGLTTLPDAAEINSDENEDEKDVDEKPIDVDDVLGNVVSQVYRCEEPNSEGNGAGNGILDKVQKMYPKSLQAIRRFISVLNGAHSPHSSLNGRTPSPPAMGNSTSAQQLPPACGARQLSKLKRFLTTLQQFGSDISPEIGERVRSLVLGLVNNHLSIEEFHAKLQEATNFPLRPFVIPFLKANLPLLQRELLHCARMAKQTPQQYLQHNEHVLFDPAHSPLESQEELNENGKRRSPDSNRPKENGVDSHQHGEHPAKRLHSMASPGSSSSRISPTGGAPYTAFHTGGPIRLEDISLSREMRERERMERERLDRERLERERERHFSNSSYNSSYHRCEQYEPLDRIEDEWKHIENMLHCIIGMVDKTKRALAVLQERSNRDREELAMWMRRHAEGLDNDMKKRTSEMMASTLRQTEDRVTEVKRRAEEAVNEVKRQAVLELQKAVAAAESKATELVNSERTKMERQLLDEKRRLLEEVSSSMNHQEESGETCWNCGRKASETCSGCNVARYCGAFCQHKDWENHHHVCGSNTTVREIQAAREGHGTATAATARQQVSSSSNSTTSAAVTASTTSTTATSSATTRRSPVSAVVVAPSSNPPETPPSASQQDSSSASSHQGSPRTSPVTVQASPAPSVGTNASKSGSRSSTPASDPKSTEATR